MHLAVVQTSPAFGFPERNVADALALCAGTAADLFIFPELFNTGYNFVDAAEAGALAEPAAGPTSAAVSRFTRERSCYAVYGFAERADRCYNSSALVGPQGLIGVYRKVHLYAKETLLFAPGNLGFPVFDLPFGRVGMMICFDWIYPESARTLALKGAELIAHPSNLVLPHCPDAMITRCLENRVFAGTADRIGREERGGMALAFIGRSQVVSPLGERLVSLGTEETGVAVAELDLAAARNKGINRYNDVLAGRQPEQYT
jgi:predicted amidohydrolase